MLDESLTEEWHKMKGCLPYHGSPIRNHTTSSQQVDSGSSRTKSAMLLVLSQYTDSSRAPLQLDQYIAALSHLYKSPAFTTH